MGQSLQRLTPAGREEKKAGDIAKTAEQIYNAHFIDPNQDSSLGDFYQALCYAVEELNRISGNTQFKVPKKAAIEKAYKKHHKGKEEALTKEEFRDMMRDVVMETGVSGIGAKDMLMYIFGVPLTTLLVKRRVIPKIIPDEFFIPLVTSATVFVLARLNKL